jgi:hypothetical protein
MTMFDDPNREAVGLEPIWTGAESGSPATGAAAGIPGTWTPSGAQAPADAAEASAWGVVASPATPWTSGQYVQGTTAGAAGRATWTGTGWVGGAAPLETDQGTTKG